MADEYGFDDFSSPEYGQDYGYDYTNFTPDYSSNLATDPFVLDNNQTYTYDDGSTITVDGNGNVIATTEATDTGIGAGTAADSAAAAIAKAAADKAAQSGIKGIFDKLTQTPTGQTDYAKLAGLGLGAYGLMGGNKVTNDNLYKGTIPRMVATRQQVPIDPNRVPGSKGQQYFTDTQYTGLYDVPAAQNVAAQQATALQAQNKAPAQAMAKGGIAGRYLQGNTDGMADKINTTIDDKQAAKLSHGEFVIPADVVSHLGNGNSDAGAQKLYAMMDRVRKARTGNAKQGKQINPDKFLGGGIAGYAGGGAVAFAEGSLVSAAAPMGGTTTQGLSQFAGDYVGNMLGKGQALSEAPYQAYTGQLTAGPSVLQSKVQTGLEGISMPANYGKSLSDTGIAQQYMNPYIQGALDPQIAEARRQAQITQMGNAAKAVQSGAFGGSRGALMDTETQRNLGTTLANITGKGYSDAFNNAQNQFNTEQGQATGLVNQIAQQGATQQATTQAGLTADQAQFNEQRDNPYKMVQYQQGLLQGLPISSTTTTPNTSGVSQLLSSIAGGTGLANQLKTFFPG